MRRVCLVLLLLVGLALVACAISRDVSISTTPGARAERPTYSVGQKWIRSDGVYELIRIEDGRYIFAAAVDRQMHLMACPLIVYTDLDGSLCKISG
jgi:hypothetical protein